MNNSQSMCDAYRSNANDPVKVMYVHMNEYAEQSRQNLST